ncbi:MAG TPA: hypothetical protein DCS82_07570 [Rhodospirillaceae bacterium]|nr:hypothetical protein [Rhodospirillaceae bacterium]|tara:strand:- start:672 stop:1052 length:381 start_codon:yes stop_codon:yes gene_type:complete
MTDLVEQTRQHLNENPDGLEQELLTEIISLRTGAIATGLMKTKQYANKIDAEVRRLRTDASGVKSKQKTPEQRYESLGDALETIASLFYLQRKMTMYDALTSAATGFGVDKGTKILKKMEKEKRRR